MCYLKNIRVGLKAIGCGIEGYRVGKPTVAPAIKFPAKEPWNVYEKENISLRWGGGISPGIAVCTREGITLGDINSIRPFEASEGSRVERAGLLLPLYHAGGHKEPQRTILRYGLKPRGN